MRFRQGHIALMADIQAVFHQVRVHRKHVDFLRFLWWPDGDFEKQPEDYRMKVHLFGAISSPSCANFALQKTAQDNQHNYDKEEDSSLLNGDLTTKEQWRYVGSANNPADAASRGVRAVSLMSKHWWTGPDFLRREETHWPIIGKLMSTDLKDLEVRNVQVHWTTVTDNPTIKFLEYYSQWNHFKRALAWFLRLKDILKTKIQGKDAVKINSAQNVGSQCLSVDELERAENAVISYVQNSSFHEEVEALQKGKQVKLTSNISSLDPILENGFLRVGGRFNKMAMPISQQHPAIFPKNSHISRLIMRHIHQTLGHSGRNHVLSKLRQHYWIPSANSLARRTIKECVLCRRLQGKAGEQKMADLRAERITPDLSPFTHVGIDYFGRKERSWNCKTIWRDLYLSCVTCHPS
ncbi:hypothetical protein SRHO_G00339750 [Serrasalmus rhombeus]